MRAALLTGLAVVALGSAASIGVIGFAHTSAGRPLLAYLPGFDAGCPVGGDLAPELRDAARATALAPYAGEIPARSRPALEFALDATTRADIAAWAAAHEVVCEEALGDLRCGAVPARDRLPAADDMLFRFDAAGRLIAIDSSVSLDAADATAVRLTDRASAISDGAGPATRWKGEATAAWLSTGPLSQTVASFQYEDYRAEVVATNLGSGRFKVRETMQSIAR